MFSFICPQKILFGRGQCQQAATLAATFGRVVLLIHGSDPSRAQWLIDGCRAAGLTMNTISCGREPSLPNIEVALTQLDGMRPDVVVALGGGSVIDFAKALAALIPCSGKPASYLEVVGDGRRLEHAPIPMIALPTTADRGRSHKERRYISARTRPKSQPSRSTDVARNRYHRPKSYAGRAKTRHPCGRVGCNHASDRTALLHK